MKKADRRINELAQRVSEAFEAEGSAPAYPPAKIYGLAVSSTSGVVSKTEQDLPVSGNGKEGPKRIK